ncbi:hypothetical protein ACFC5Z_33945 [Streptomyces sp. NPDC056004]|uniref:hypothetical protein n=1 Tax=Streptomyces sp. NPDC056004 TaxID=3345677 RepID=UPI0035DF634F
MAGTGPASAVSLTAPLRGQGATLGQLRVDRQPEEALAHGPDPLHLAEVFGLDVGYGEFCVSGHRHL